MYRGLRVQPADRIVDINYVLYVLRVSLLSNSLRAGKGQPVYNPYCWCLHSHESLPFHCFLLDEQEVPTDVLPVFCSIVRYLIIRSDAQTHRQVRMERRVYGSWHSHPV